MKFICLLRGINVSGQKLIKMEHLRAFFTTMGFEEVQTYIQSGNIVFEGGNSNPYQISTMIEKGLYASLGYKVSFFIRNFTEWCSTVNANPFPGQVGDPAYKLYVTFLEKEPESALASKLLSFCNSNETYVLQGRELYVLLSKNSDVKQNFSNNFVENKLKTLATTRNWDTILKLQEYDDKLDKGCQ